MAAQPAAAAVGHDQYNQLDQEEQRPQDVVDRLFSFIYDQDQHSSDGLSDQEDSVEVPDYNRSSTWPTQDKEDEHIYQNLAQLQQVRSKNGPGCLTGFIEPHCKKPRFSSLALEGGLGQSVDSGVVSNISWETLSSSSPTQTSASIENHAPLLQEALKGTNRSIVRVSSINGSDCQLPAAAVSEDCVSSSGVRVTTTNNVYVNCNHPHAATAAVAAAAAAAAATTSIYLHAEDPTQGHITDDRSEPYQLPKNGLDTQLDMIMPQYTNTYRCPGGNDDVQVSLPAGGGGSPSLTNTYSCPGGNDDVQVSLPAGGEGSPSLTITINQGDNVVDDSKDLNDPCSGQDWGYQADTVTVQLEEFNAKFPSFDEPEDLQDDISQAGTKVVSDSVSTLGHQCNRDQHVVDIAAIQCEFVDQIDRNTEKRKHSNIDFDTNKDASEYDVLKNVTDNNKSFNKICYSDMLHSDLFDSNTQGRCIYGGPDGGMEEEVSPRMEEEVSSRLEEVEDVSLYPAVQQYAVPGPAQVVVSNRYNHRQRCPASGPHGDTTTGGSSPSSQLVPDIDSCTITLGIDTQSPSPGASSQLVPLPENYTCTPTRGNDTQSLESLPAGSPQLVPRPGNDTCTPTQENDTQSLGSLPAASPQLVPRPDNDTCTPTQGNDIQALGSLPAVSPQLVPLLDNDTCTSTQGNDTQTLVSLPSGSPQLFPDIDTEPSTQQSDHDGDVVDRLFSFIYDQDQHDANDDAADDFVTNDAPREGCTSNENADFQKPEDIGASDSSLNIGDLVRDSNCLVQAFNARFPSDPTRITHNPIYTSCDTISHCVPIFTSTDVITLDTYDPARGIESNTDDGLITGGTLPKTVYAGSEGGTSVSLSLHCNDTDGSYSIASSDGRVSASSSLENTSITDSSRTASSLASNDGCSITPYSSDDGIISTPTPEAVHSPGPSIQFEGSSTVRQCTAELEGAGSPCCVTSPCTDSVCDDCISCSCDEGISDDDDLASGGLGVAVSRAVRRSMRRMKRLRLSTGSRRRSSRRRQSQDHRDSSSGLSLETEIRRDLPSAPEVGLATVRSPATASIMVTSLMAALVPGPTSLEAAPISPRETLTIPQNLLPNTRSQASSNVRRESGHNGRRRRSRHQRSSRNRGSSHQDSSNSNPLDTGPPDDPHAGGPLSLDSYYSSASGPLSTSTPLHTSLPSSPIPPASPTRQAEDGRPWPAAGPFIPRPLVHSSMSTGSSTSSSNITSSSSISTSTTTTTNSGSNSSVVNQTTVSTSHHLTAGRQTNSISEGSSDNSSQGPGDGTNLPTRGTGGTTNTRNSSGPRPTTSLHSRDRRRHRRRESSQTNDSNNNTQVLTPGGTNTTNNDNTNTTTNNSNNIRNAPRLPHRRNTSNGGVGHVTLETERAHVQGGTWDHSHSALMASLAVTVTTFNISRFAVLGAHFGWCFVVQWVLVSFVLGLPLMTFHVTVGKYLGAGVIDMWRISPIFQGVGFSVVIAQALLGVYCCVPTAWLFVYFRDSFITHNNRFRWADCQLVDCTAANASKNTLVIEGVPSYFNTKVLQRNETNDWMHELGSLKFDLAFNIALIWIITLIALSKGNQSYGKVCYIVFLLPLLCFLVVCVYLTSWTDDLYINKTNSSFMDPMCWMSASREVFLVWGLHGAVLQQMAAHNRKSHSLYRDTTVLTIITMLVLILAAVMGSSCLAGIIKDDLYPKPSSFENTVTAQFLSKTNQAFHPGFGSDINQIERPIYPVVPEYATIPTYSTAYDNFYTGIRIRPLKTREQDLMGDRREPGVSGYQSIRVATELFPALLAINTARKISPFWSSLFYLSLLLFGIAQQLSVWRTVVEAVIRINHERLQPWETFITFLCCLFGFSAALPMATGAGIHILYFLDYVVSCGWWLMIIQLVQMFAVLFVRGKPYSGQDIVSELMGGTANCRSLWQGPLTSFSWNIIVPVGLLVLSISSFKAGDYREVFAWSSTGYWKDWVCQLASAMQLFPILLVSIVGLIQTCRYLCKTEYDLFERIQLLYRPSLRQRINSGLLSSMYENEDSDDEFVARPTGNDSTPVTETAPRPYSDPPPKYTPPPSYSTATGVRFAKLLNHGLRASVRRLRDTLRATSESEGGRDGEIDQERVNQEQSNSQSSNSSSPYIPPPDYVVAVNEYTSNQTTVTNSSDPPPIYATLDPIARQRALSALSGNNSTATEAKTSEVVSSPEASLQRNNSLRRSGLRRSLTSGVRRSARRLAATLGVARGESDASLLNSEAPVSMDTNVGGTNVDAEHPHAYTNFEMVTQSEA